MPGLSNPRHDPWSAALLPGPTQHTGICLNDDDADYADYDYDYDGDDNNNVS